MSIRGIGVKIHRENRKEVYFMHDYIITSYNVDFKKRTIEIYAQNQEKEESSQFFAQEVLTHSFNTILEYNIVSHIQEYSIDNFIKNNLTTIEELQQSSWPINFEDIEELKDFLIHNHYKYIEISCSYGLQGWVLAKNYQIK